jgi:hypothetical protein
LHTAQLALPQLNNGCFDFGRRIRNGKDLIEFKVFETKSFKAQKPPCVVPEIQRNF